MNFFWSPVLPSSAQCRHLPDTGISKNSFFLLRVIQRSRGAFCRKKELELAGSPGRRPYLTAEKGFTPCNERRLRVAGPSVAPKEATGSEFTMEVLLSWIVGGFIAYVVLELVKIWWNRH